MLSRQQLEAQYRSRAFGQAMPPPMHMFPYQTAPRFIPPHPHHHHHMMNQRRQQQQQWGAPQQPPMNAAPAANMVGAGSKPMPYAQAVIAGGRGMNPSTVQGRGVPAARGGRGQRGGNMSSRGGYKFNQNARNRPPHQQQHGGHHHSHHGHQQQQQVPMPAQGFATYMPPQLDENALTLSNLADFPPEIQKNIIGDRLFPIVLQQQPELAGKITGMLLEMDMSDLLHLLESPEALNAKIVEAVSVLTNPEQQ